jgi:hypothetical protein
MASFRVRLAPLLQHSNIRFYCKAIFGTKKKLERSQN